MECQNCGKEFYECKTSVWNGNSMRARIVYICPHCQHRNY